MPCAFRVDALVRALRTGLESALVEAHANVFSVERAKHLVFFGRRDLFAHIDHLLCEGTKWILVSGSPGSGTSAIISNYLLRLETAGLGGQLHWVHSWLRHGTAQKSALGELASHLVTVKSSRDHRIVPQHFIRYGYLNWAVPAAIEQSLLDQVGLVFPRLVDPKDTGPQRLPRLLVRASADVLVPKGKRLILVIDGLGQVEGDWRSNPLFEFLPADLPDGITVLCGTRPLYGELAPLDWTTPVRIDLDSPEWAESFFDVQIAMLKAHGEQIGHPADYANDAIKVADGNLGYLHELLAWKAEYPRAPIGMVPPKYLAYLDELWQFITRDGLHRDAIRAGLRVFVDGERWVAQADIAKQAAWSEPDDADAFYRAVTPVLLSKREDEGPFYKVFHPSFGSFIAAKQREADLVATARAVMPLGRALSEGEAIQSTVTHRYAIVIGVNNYVEGGLGLRYCQNDATAMAALLTQLGYTVILLTDDAADEDHKPTVFNIRAALAALKARFGEDELCLVYFAGHGALVDGAAYLLGRDSRTADLRNTALPLRDVESYLRDSGSRRLILILDACHSGVDIGRDPTPVGRGIDPAFIHNTHELAVGFVVLAGCTATQRSQDDPTKQHGVYTFYLLEGLSGKAATTAGSKRFVTVDDLKDYVLNSVRAWCFANMAALQMPTARIEGVGDMILAYVAATADEAATVPPPNPSPAV
jgi:hypothetical protein